EGDALDLADVDAGDRHRLPLPRHDSLGSLEAGGDVVEVLPGPVVPLMDGDNRADCEPDRDHRDHGGELHAVAADLELEVAHPPRPFASVPIASRPRRRAPRFAAWIRR